MIHDWLFLDLECQIRASHSPSLDQGYAERERAFILPFPYDFSNKN